MNPAPQDWCIQNGACTAKLKCLTLAIQECHTPLAIPGRQAWDG
jgi:hypothetical protein